MVYFIGGVTYAEVAALRFLAKKMKDKIKAIYIATTNMINGDKLIKSLLN